MGLQQQTLRYHRGLSPRIFNSLKKFYIFIREFG
jgi:hypothetical protein